VRIAYLDCATGIAGDMTLAALIDAGVDANAIRAGIDSLGLPGVSLTVNTVQRCGFRATYVRVEHPEQHAHRGLRDIEAIIVRADKLTVKQRDTAMRMFRAVAEAEARVHGTTVDQVHFHEVGAIDSIVDIVGVAIGFDLLGVEQVVCSSVPTGRGQVKIAHGICPVPAPATAEMLKGVPLRDVPLDAELTTPTGAAIVATLVDRFGPLPELTIEVIGLGAGTKDFRDRANILRLFVGTAKEVSPYTDQVFVLETNLDDVTGEVIGYTKQKLLGAGALDVFTVPIQMKKDRPGVLLSVICQIADREKLETILFDETQTFGIRRHLVERSKREREACEVETDFGWIKGKMGWRNDDDLVFTPEFDSCAAAAGQHNITLHEVYHAAESAFAASMESAGEPHEHDDGHDDSHDHDHDHSGHDHNHSHDHSHDHGHDHDHHH
jgi:uncharacterized protein (TIGR00299 family) protein